MAVQSLAYYIERHLDGSITSQERQELIQLLNDPANTEELNRLADENIELWERHPLLLAEGISRVKSKLLLEIQNDYQENAAVVHRVHFLRRGWFKYAAAILIIAGIGAYLFITNSRKSQEIVNVNPLSIENDILPGSQKAILTLSDGRKVELDSAASETINDGNLSIENNAGQLIYKKGDVVVMNTMTTPKGGQYQLTLADGSRVWLNTASSITYPTSFKGKTREVTITGEAFFEVRKNSMQPFIVKSVNQEIQVLGTQFNVNVYTDEPVSKTSLVEGAIRIDGQVLKPGQALIDGKITATDIQQDIAWKNGFFNFQQTDLPAALRQLGRWYNVDIVFQSGVPSKKIRGKMERSLTLSQVLKILKGFGVNTELQDHKLVVLPE